jgi:hypothetical protein
MKDLSRDLGVEKFFFVLLRLPRITANVAVVKKLNGAGFGLLFAVTVETCTARS